MTTSTVLTDAMKAQMRIPYAMRRVPEDRIVGLQPCQEPVETGDIVLAQIEKLGKNGGLELPSGRRCTLHEGDLLAVVFGNRYATHQFEGYARRNGDRCDMLSMGGLCGMVESKHASVAEPTKLRLLGAITDADRHALNLRDFALPFAPTAMQPSVTVVCGSSMDSGKTYATMSLIVGLRQRGYRVAGIKVTGTAAGRDRWSMVDAGACVALDFVDGGWPSTYRCTLDELLGLYSVLVSHAAAEGAERVVIEIADGLLQQETAALLQCDRFTSTVNSWVFAAGEPMAAASGVAILRGWGINPVAVTGVVSMSPLGIQETQGAINLECVTARQLQDGVLNERLARPVPTLVMASGAVGVADGE